jgi:hypothetical protein
MPRVEWVKYRLDNWALWHARQQEGGLGYYSSSSFLHEASADRYREAVVPVDEVDAALTDQAVQSLRPDRDHLHLTLCCIYLKGLGVKETARRQARAESTIKAHLEQADQAIALWFRLRADSRARSSTT